jgi:hypothetical protein
MTQAIRVAILDEQIPAQLRERPDEAEGLEVVWNGTNLEELLRFTARESPQVIVADLDRLGADPASSAEQLLSASAAELFITVYKFAPRSAIEHLAGDKRRVVRAPVSIPMLKTHMMGTIVRGMLAQTAAPRAPRPSKLPAAQLRSGGLPPEDQRFTDAQLGTLRERQSRLACECPNHVAELVSSLVAFERYSRACANRDDDDAAMHRALARATGEARRTMELALVDLLRFEDISV